MSKVSKILAEFRAEINKKNGVVTDYKVEGDWKPITKKKNSDGTVQRPESRAKELAHKKPLEMKEAEELEEGWKKEDSRSNEKTNRDRVGHKVTTPDGPGTIEVERKRPTFSRLVPYSHEITVKHDNGKISSHHVRDVKMVKMVKKSEEINEAIRSADFPKATTLIKRYLVGKLGKVYFYPTPEVFRPASGGKGVGIKFFVNGNEAVRLNWLGTNVGKSNGLISMDYWDGSKLPQPFPSHHVKFDVEQSIAKVLPFVVDFVKGKIDRTGESIFVTEEVSE